MDDELRNLEAELKRLRPVAPPPRVVAAIETELATRRPAAPSWGWAVALPAAAAVAMLAGVAMRRDLSNRATARTQPAAAGVLKPVEVENVLYSARDEGEVTLADGTIARRERLRFVDTITWKNPQTNASLRWSVPREEVHVVPISFQ
jgi:hypothetical protein